MLATPNGDCHRYSSHPPCIYYIVGVILSYCIVVCSKEVDKSIHHLSIMPFKPQPHASKSHWLILLDLWVIHRNTHLYTINIFYIVSPVDLFLSNFAQLNHQSLCYSWTIYFIISRSVSKSFKVLSRLSVLSICYWEPQECVLPWSFNIR